jgi:alpha-tubulin suppressor-like RCC1 family protein
MNGQAGVGSTNNPYMLQVSPRQAFNPGTRRWRAVEAGRVASVAAICTDGFLYTWGANNYGELGRNPNATTSSPQRVNHPVDSTITWRSVSAGLRFMVAVDEHGEMWSWGQNTYGKLGRGGNHDAPGRVVFPQGYAPRFNEVSISQGTQHVLALDTEHRLWAWGRNANGQIGNGSTGGTSTPVMVTVPQYGITQWFSANAGAEFSVAISRSLTHENNGIIFTWGQNTFGQMGNPALVANNFNTPQRLDIAR